MKWGLIGPAADSESAECRVAVLTGVVNPQVVSLAGATRVLCADPMW